MYCNKIFIAKISDQCLIATSVSFYRRSASNLYCHHFCICISTTSYLYRHHVYICISTTFVFVSPPPLYLYCHHICICMATTFVFVSPPPLYFFFHHVCICITTTSVFHHLTQVGWNNTVGHRGARNNRSEQI